MPVGQTSLSAGSFKFGGTGTGRVGYMRSTLLVVPFGPTSAAVCPAHGYLFRRPLSSMWWMLYLSALNVVEPFETRSGRVRTALTEGLRSRKVTRMGNSGGARACDTTAPYHRQTQKDNPPWRMPSWC